MLKFEMWISYSGWKNFLSGNGLEMTFPKDFRNFQTFLNSSCIKEGLHVGRDRSYEPFWDSRLIFSKKDYYYSTRHELETLLNADYRILFFASQFDMVVLHVGISEFLKTLQWKRSKDFLEADRKVWRVDGDSSMSSTIGGFVKEVEGMTYLLIRNSGHMPCLDHSDWCFDMITRFTNGTSFSSNP